MAVTMSGAQVEHSARDTLLSQSIDSSFQSGGAKGGLFGGAPLAGITASFATNVTSAIDAYIYNINSIVTDIENEATSKAFRGEEITLALNKFINSVEIVALNYTNALKNAETQIVNSVSRAYTTQDTDVGSNVSSDGSNLEGSNTFSN